VTVDKQSQVIQEYCLLMLTSSYNTDLQFTTCRCCKHWSIAGRIQHNILR